MTKAELVKRLSESNDFESNAAASRTVELFISIITEEVKSGNEVIISGLGKFYPATQSARSGTSTLTGKPFSSPAKQVPKFKAAAPFKTAVAGN